MKKLAAVLRTGKTVLAVASMLCLFPGAASAQTMDKSFGDMVKKFVLVPKGEPESEMLAKATLAVTSLQHMELTKANRAINEALQLAPANSQLHFLNAFVYHLQAKQGDTQKNEMAIEGYQQALRLDPGNWIAQEFLGLAFLDLKKFDDAKHQFAEVLLMTPDSTVSLYGMMVSSYLTGDARTACAMADQFKTQSAQPPADFLKSSVAVYASCGDFDQAEQMRAQLAALPGGTDATARIDRRVAQWKSVYAAPARIVPASLKGDQLQLAQAFTVPKSIPKPPPSAASSAAPEAPAVTPADAAPAVPVTPAAAAAAPSDTSPRMVLVDVVLVSVQELVSTAKGVNLLNALTLQLGSVAGNVSAYSNVITRNSTAGAAGSVSSAITRAVTVPALAYSLNIANANNSINEVLARPTLAAIEGMPSEFFSGTNLSAGVVSASTQGGTTVIPVEKKFGIKLAVTPTFLSNGRVQLKVEAQRTSLNATTDTSKVAYQLEIAEISANANVVMRVGDTLVLSGLSEKSKTTTRDGVPVLQDVPGLQYLFSHKQTNDIQRSVLMLITPRAPAYTAMVDGVPGPAADNVQALREKFGFAGGTSNADAVLSHLKPNTLFREFREGDVTLERWDRMDSTGARLRQSLEFLYF